MDMNHAIKIVAIDDKPDNLTALRAVIRDALPEATLLSALNDLAGIELAAAEDPDVILLDIVMPGMDGFEICRRLKADDRLRDIPVVFLTALHTDAASRAQALQVGGEGFLAKPLEIAEVTAQIRAMAKIKAANRLRQAEQERLETLVAERTQELKNSEARYHALFENINSGVVIYEAVNDGEDFRIVNFNRSAEMIEKNSRSEVIGKLVTEAFPGVKEFGLFQVFQRVWKTGKPERYPIGFYRDKRIEGWRENYIARLPTGEVIAVYDDVTEKKRLETELQDLARFPSENPMPVMRFFSDGTLITANKASDEILSLWTLPEGLIIPADIQQTVQQAFHKSETIQIEIATSEKTFACIIVPITERGYANLYGYDITERRQAEQALSQTSATLQGIIDSHSMPIFSLDTEYRYTSFNKAHQAAMKILYNAEIQIGHSLYEYQTNIADQQKSMPNLNRALAGEMFVEESISGEPSLKQLFFEIAHNPIRNAQGTVIGVAVFAKDITQLKQATLELQANQQYLQTILDSVGDAIFVDDADTGEVIDVNERMCQMYGYTRAEALQIPISQLSYGEPPYSDAEILNWLQKASTEGSQTFEWLAKRKDGSLFWVEVKINPTSIGGKNRFVVSVRDISERKHTEEIQHESQELYRALFQNNHAAMLVIDPDTGIIVDVNPAAVQTYGWSREEFTSMYVHEINTLSPEEVTKEIQRAYSQQRNFFQFKHRWRNGMVRDVEVYSGPVQRQGKTLLYSIVHDVTERKQMEQERQQLYEALNASLNEIYLFDAETLRFSFVSKGAQRNLGYSSEELEQMTPIDIKTEFTLETFEEKIAPLRRGEIPALHFETIHQRKDATTYPVEVHLQLFKHPERCVFLAIIMDISERKWGEEALRLSEERLRLLISNMAEGVALHEIIFDENNTAVNYRLMDCNPEFELITHLKKEEVVGRLATEIYQQDTAPYLEIYKAVVLNQQPTRFETYYPPFDLYLEISVAPWGEHGFATIFTDITERKYAEKRIQQLNAELEQRVEERTLDLNNALEFLQRIMASTTTGISAYDQTGQCILANDTMANIIGATKEQVLQQNYHQIHSWKQTGLYDLALAALETGITQQKDVHIRTTFGKETWLDCRFSSFGAPEKRHLLLTVVDISERMQREEKIQKMNDLLQEQAASLEASNKELESFSYSVSHDLRAPLRAVDGYTNILVEDYGSQLSPEAMEVCNVIRNNTRRMSQLIDDMLNLSRAGRMELHPMAVDMKAMVQSVLTELTTAGERQRIEFELAELPRAECDPVMIHQVWSNLISNAIKFTSRCKTAKIQVGYTSENQKIVYYIRDNGAGFDMRYVHKLFGVFQRLHGIKEYPGTGVGLAIVQRMIHRHGGQVWAEGSVGNGATFYFTLPTGKE